MEAVAKRAGVGIGTLYRHFPRDCRAIGGASWKGYCRAVFPLR